MNSTALSTILFSVMESKKKIRMIEMERSSRLEEAYDQQRADVYGTYGLRSALQYC